MLHTTSPAGMLSSDSSTSSLGLDVLEQEVVEYIYNTRTRKWDMSKEVYRIETSERSSRRSHEARGSLQFRAWKRDSEDTFLVSHYRQTCNSEQVGRARCALHTWFLCDVAQSAAACSLTSLRLPWQCFDDAMIQLLAQRYARKFNKQCGAAAAKQPGLKFSSIWVIKLGAGQLACVERLKACSSEQGSETPHEEYVQAFSHFSLVQSKNHFVICDFERGSSDGAFRHSCIHTVDGEGFGWGNHGRAAIDRFRQTHVCNHVCRTLGLPACTSCEATPAGGLDRAQPLGLAPTRTAPADECLSPTTVTRRRIVAELTRSASNSPKQKPMSSPPESVLLVNSSPAAAESGKAIPILAEDASADVAPCPNSDEERLTQILHKKTMMRQRGRTARDNGHFSSQGSITTSVRSNSSRSPEHVPSSPCSVSEIDSAATPIGGMSPVAKIPARSTSSGSSTPTSRSSMQGTNDCAPRHSNLEKVAPLSAPRTGMSLWKVGIKGALGLIGITNIEHKSSEKRPSDEISVTVDGYKQKPKRAPPLLKKTSSAQNLFGSQFGPVPRRIQRSRSLERLPDHDSEQFSATAGKPVAATRSLSPYRPEANAQLVDDQADSELHPPGVDVTYSVPSPLRARFDKAIRAAS